MTIIDNYYVDEIVSFMYKFNFSLDEWIEGVGNMEMKKKLEGFQFWWLNRIFPLGKLFQNSKFTRIPSKIFQTISNKNFEAMFE